MEQFESNYEGSAGLREIIHRKGARPYRSCDRHVRAGKSAEESAEENLRNADMPKKKRPHETPPNRRVNHKYRFGGDSFVNGMKYFIVGFQAEKKRSFVRDLISAIPNVD